MSERSLNNANASVELSDDHLLSSSPTNQELTSPSCSSCTSCKPTLPVACQDQKV